MNKDKKRKRVSLDDNEKCEVISSSISKMISSSENPIFVHDCRRLLQAENINEMKNTLKSKFMEATIDKKSENSSFSRSQELDDSLHSFLENAENIFAYEDELVGFADWERL